MKVFNPINHPICFTYPLRTAPSSWMRHIPFALCVIDLLRPDVFVELGTSLGTSYCAFCQAIKELGLGTRCFAIDTWQGNLEIGLSGPEALADLRLHHDPRYSSFSRLIQATFDEALEQFANGTIDLLHIDSNQSYKVARRDFDRWLPKMSERGVILLHDTSERTETLGAWKLFQEEKRRHPHFEFLHGHGLGILAVGQHCPEPLRWLLEAPKEARSAIGAFFFQLGVRIEMQTELESRRSIALPPPPALAASSPGIRAINLTRAALKLLFTQGPVTVIRRVLLWLGGKRGYWKTSKGDI